MRGIWQNLKQVRKEINIINYKEYKGVIDKVQQLRRDLETIQNQMRSMPIPHDIQDAEKKAKEQLMKWNAIEETIYK